MSYDEEKLKYISQCPDLIRNDNGSVPFWWFKGKKKKVFAFQGNYYFECIDIKKLSKYLKNPTKEEDIWKNISFAEMMDEDIPDNIKDFFLFHLDLFI